METFFNQLPYELLLIIHSYLIPEKNILINLDIPIFNDIADTAIKDIENFCEFIDIIFDNDSAPEISFGKTKLVSEGDESLGGSLRDPTKLVSEGNKSGSAVGATTESIFNNKIYWTNFYTLLLGIDEDVKLIIETKPITENYCQQCINLLFANYPNKMANKGRLDALIWLSKKNIFPDILGANWAAKYGHIEVLKWLSKVVTCEDNFREANGEIKRGIFPDYRGANLAAENGHLKILKWLFDQNIFPDQSGAESATINGNLDILLLLSKKNIFPDFNLYNSNMLAASGHLEVLIWFFEEKGIEPDHKEINLAAENGHLNVLKWAYSNKIKIYSEAADCALKNKQLEILDWLYNIGIKPSTQRINWESYYGHHEVIKWLWDKGFYK